MINKTFLLCAVACASFLLLQVNTGCGAKEEEEVVEQKDTLVPNMAYGFDLNNYEVYYDTVQPNWTLSHLFMAYNVSQAQINEAYELSRDSAKLNYIDKDKVCIMLCRKDSDTLKDVEHAIYVKNLVDYYVFSFSDTVIEVAHREKKIDTTIKQIGAKIKQGGNLSFAISREVEDNNISYPLVDEIAGVYSWSIDFFHLQPNDKLKIIYEERSVEGQKIGIGKIRSILFNHNDHDFYAFRYQVDSAEAYYNEQGKGMKSMFLSAPLKYTRISSGYNLRRYIKLYGRIKPHLGTDYAAPRGTPIWTTANGVVSRKGYNRGNGNFIKVKHNEQYSTQYLHMSKFAEGIKVGQYVEQGEVIGYVGSTGASTGPHVCYRFWKDGKQVDSRKQKFENAQPMDSTHLPAYMEFMDSVKLDLDKIEYPVFIIDSTEGVDTLMLDSLMD